MFILPPKQRAVPPALFPICIAWSRKQPSASGVIREKVDQVLGDTIIERTSFEMKGVGGITRTASGTMHVNGRVRGYINGVVDAEIKGVLHGQFNASIATGTEFTVEKPDMYLSEENVRETADNPDTTDDTAKGGDAE